MKMKMAWLLVGLVAAGVSASAQDLSRGRNALALSGSVRLDEPEPIDYQVFLDIRYGRFVLDRLQVGANMGVFANDVSWTLTLGPLVEYNFNLGNRWPRLSRLVPFVGASVALATAEIDEDWKTDIRSGEGVSRTESSTGLAVNGEVGLKQFLSDSVALTASFNLAWSSDDVFNGRSDMKHILLGVRAYY